MTKWHLLSILALSIILGIIVWKASPLLDSTEEAFAEKTFPASYFTRSKTTQYDEQGAITHILVADKISNYEASASITQNYSLLEQPRFTFYNNTLPKQAPWLASAAKARTQNNNEDILFTGNVVLIQENAQGTIPTTIVSEELLVKPNQQYAETSKPVMIKTESGVTKSVGLKISLDSHIVELLSNVRSRYEAR